MYEGLLMDSFHSRGGNGRRAIHVGCEHSLHNYAMKLLFPLALTGGDIQYNTLELQLNGFHYHWYNR